SKRPRRSL
uniref:Uncharacterized protein n=1 Tax=Solanum lycopersicum TaxID=4081 RepID=A0A3Q7GL48_SOLLC